MTRQYLQQDAKNAVKREKVELALPSEHEHFIQNKTIMT